MSKERKNLGEDQLVADTYKGLAREQAPEHLNEKVLLLASGGRSRYSLTRAWTRPLAWAATIGLSLALVLELNRLPQIEPEPAGVSASGRVAGPDRDMTDEEGTAAAAQAQMPASAPAVDRVVETKRSRPAVPAEEHADHVSMDEFVPREMTVLRDAEDLARAQAGPDQAPIAPLEKVDDGRAEEAMAEEKSALASFAVVAEKNAGEADPTCPA
ncbi:MAG: hypothetical protein GY785_07315 [Gammaproteobacteria bacterium]|nr:hypothetical protein [Gammaproteobacteria bacterium]